MNPLPTQYELATPAQPKGVEIPQDLEVPA